MTGSSPGPDDIPVGRSDWLDDLDALLGEWSLEASFPAGSFGPDSAAVTASGGTTTFEWLDGRYFLIQRFVAENPAAPNGIAIIGAAGEPGHCRQHYCDSRGVARVYEMSLRDGIWRLWRDEPGFSQRYEGRISDDGRRIEGGWSKSVDGADWHHDFGLTYILSSVT